jgi:RimJ/RimL family protein N-acetyltransferase
VSWWNDPRVQTGLNTVPRNWTMKDAQKHVAKFNNMDKFHLGIFHKTNDLLIGFITVFVQKKDKVGKLNIVIGNKQYWGKRVPEELKTVVFPFVFDTLKMDKMRVDVDGKNRSSIMMCKRLGYELEGVLKQETLHIDGDRSDLYLFGLLKQDWVNLNSQAIETTSTAESD